MITIPVIVGTDNSRLALGYRGETNAKEVVFDISWLIDTYGAGTAILMAKRSMDSSPYPVGDWVQSGNTLTWTITNVDTSYIGQGSVELFWYVNNTLAKTMVYKTWVDPDIGASVGTTPDPYETWVDELTELGAEILENIDTAVDAKDDAIAAKNDAIQAKDDAVAAKDLAVSAKNDAVSAKNDAVSAKTAAVNAKNDAVSAKNDAVSAKNDAVSAKNDAVDAKVAAEAARDRAEAAAALLNSSIIIGNDGNFYIND